MGDCSIVTSTCTNDPLKECVEVALSYDYDAHPLTPKFPGVGIVLPSTLEYDAVARVS